MVLRHLFPFIGTAAVQRSDNPIDMASYFRWGPLLACSEDREDETKSEKKCVPTNGTSHQTSLFHFEDREVLLRNCEDADCDRELQQCV
jgi:hypothetical protein